MEYCGFILWPIVCYCFAMHKNKDCFMAIIGGLIFGPLAALYYWCEPIY